VKPCEAREESVLPQQNTMAIRLPQQTIAVAFSNSRRSRAKHGKKVFCPSKTQWQSVCPSKRLLLRSATHGEAVATATAEEGATAPSIASAITA